MRAPPAHPAWRPLEAGLLVRVVKQRVMKPRVCVSIGVLHTWRQSDQGGPFLHGVVFSHGVTSPAVGRALHCRSAPGKRRALTRGEGLRVSGP